MSQAVGKFEYKRGETVTFGIRASNPAYDGTETVTCDIKPAANGRNVPSDSMASVLSVTPVFVAASGEVAAHYLFTLTPAQTAALEPRTYITDAKTVSSTGFVDQADPILIDLSERVTA
jgi:hypothetical protein